MTSKFDIKAQEYREKLVEAVAESDEKPKPKRCVRKPIGRAWRPRRSVRRPVWGAPISKAPREGSRDDFGVTHARP